MSPPGQIEPVLGARGARPLGGGLRLDGGEPPPLPQQGRDVGRLGSGRRWRTGGAVPFSAASSRASIPNTAAKYVTRRGVSYFPPEPITP